MRQGDYITPIQDLTFINPETRRKIVMRRGVRYWITSSILFSEEHGAVMIGRAGRDKLGQGFPFTVADAESYFQPLGAEE